MAHKLLTLLNDFPPIVCRLMARTKKRGRNYPLSDRAISDSSGIPVYEVRYMSHLCSWDQTVAGKLIPFTTACGVDFSDHKSLSRNYKYIRRGLTLDFLKRDREWGSRWYPLYMEYVAYLTGKRNGET